jgi:MoaA/NifB/PqqE/SkfB family radical SAM enzyme
VALAHFARVPDPVASFGQGCEGEPLLAGPVIEKAVAIIRKKTAKGVLNMNTNGSSPAMIAKLFDAGLDTIRVSTNTVREPYYARYYRPKGYSFKDVIRSIRAAKRRRGFVSINYLSIPGFTDTAEEFRALKNFVEKERIDMIQWRNLNFDPMEYFRIIKFRPSASDMLGMREVMRMLKRKFPRLVTGYFNPGRKKICPS